MVPKVGLVVVWAGVFWATPKSAPCLGISLNFHKNGLNRGPASVPVRCRRRSGFFLLPRSFAFWVSIAPGPGRVMSVVGQRSQAENWLHTQEHTGKYVPENELGRIFSSLEFFNAQRPSADLSRIIQCPCDVLQRLTQYQVPFQYCGLLSVTARNRNRRKGRKQERFGDDRAQGCMVCSF